jgi:hypothetical protein
LAPSLKRPSIGSALRETVIEQRSERFSNGGAAPEFGGLDAGAQVGNPLMERLAREINDVEKMLPSGAWPFSSPVKRTRLRIRFTH